MNKVNIIRKILTEKDYTEMPALSKKDLLLNKIYEYLKQESDKRMITYPDENIINMVIGINKTIIDYKERKKFNINLIKAITYVMSEIQDQEIKYMLLKNGSSNMPPILGYNTDGNLIFIKSSGHLNDNIESLILILEYLNDTFMIEESKKKVLIR